MSWDQSPTRTAHLWSGTLRTCHGSSHPLSWVAWLAHPATGTTASTHANHERNRTQCDEWHTKRAWCDEGAEHGVHIPCVAERRVILTRAQTRDAQVRGARATADSPPRHPHADGCPCGACAPSRARETRTSYPTSAHGECSVIRRHERGCMRMATHRMHGSVQSNAPRIVHRVPCRCTRACQPHR